MVSHPITVPKHSCGEAFPNIQPERSTGRIQTTKDTAARSGQLVPPLEKAASPPRDQSLDWKRFPQPVAGAQYPDFNDYFTTLTALCPTLTALCHDSMTAMNNSTTRTEQVCSRPAPPQAHQGAPARSSSTHCTARCAARCRCMSE